MIRSIKIQLFKIQLYFETHRLISSISYLVGIVVILLLIISSFLKINLMADFNSEIILLGICSIFILSLDYLHFTIIRSQRIELDGRKKLISELLSSVEPDYQYSGLKEIHNILPNGDGLYKRVVQLAYSGNNMSWYSLTFGSTDDVETEVGDIRAYSIPERKFLPRISFSTYPGKQQAIIILDPPLSKSNSEIGLEVNGYWKKIWLNAIKNKSDDGRLIIYHNIANFELEIIPPERKKVINFITNPSVESLSGELDYPLDGRVLLKLTNPEPGNLTYKFELEKI